MDVFGALADPKRRALLVQLDAGPARVVDLTREHSISRPAISRHLRVLTEAGLVDADDHGRERHYRLRPDGLRPVQHWLDGIHRIPLRIGEDQLAALDLEVLRTGRDHRKQGQDSRDRGTTAEETA